MNWIIRKSEKMKYHTHLDVLMYPILDDLDEFNWLLSDLEFNSTQEDADLPINLDHDYFILGKDEFNKLLKADLQIWWGVILAIPKSVNIIVDDDNLPFAEGNGLIWRNGNIQHPEAQIEIVCFDSGYTIVKFKDEYLSDKFKNYFTEAIELEKFSDKFIGSK